MIHLVRFTNTMCLSGSVKICLLVIQYLFASWMDYLWFGIEATHVHAILQWPKWGFIRHNTHLGSMEPQMCSLEPRFHGSTVPPKKNLGGTMEPLNLFCVAMEPWNPNVYYVYCKNRSTWWPPSTLFTNHSPDLGQCGQNWTKVVAL